MRFSQLGEVATAGCSSVRIAVGLPGGFPSVEDVAANLDEIRDISQPVVPGNANDEIMLLAQMLSE